jgi:N-acetylglucosaminyldiphosphoundecaprenol N-acetyl-beta-D-mannosaminyltransferase
MRSPSSDAALFQQIPDRALAPMEMSGARPTGRIPNAIWPDDLSREVYGVLGIPLDVTDMATVLRRIKSADDNATPFLISTANLNYLVISQSDYDFRKSLLLSDLCIADGMPIVWIPRLLGIPVKERIAGSDIFEALKFPRDAFGRVKVFLFGAEDGVAALACQNLNAGMGNMTCVGSYYPGFGTVEELSDDSIIDEINESGADFLVVALGAEKGQAWLLKNHDRLQVPIRVHLGATLKYEARMIDRAPVFLRKMGFEWLWRIKEEPYLWSRYFKDGLALLRLMATNVLPLLIFARWYRLKAGHNGHDLQIGCHEGDTSVVLSLNGAAVAQHVVKALPHFQDALNADKSIVIDFADTCSIDARFIGLLLMLNKQLLARQLQLTLTGVQRHIAKILCLNGFDFLLSAKSES